MRVAHLLMLAALAACAPTRAGETSSGAAGTADCPLATLPAYAHNDYANARPLADALALGMRGVEADLFLADGVLRVAHDRRAARRAPTFESLYLAPIGRTLSRCGGITAARPLLLTVELKEPDQASFDTLVALLARAPQAIRSGRVQIVLVGWHPSPESSAWRTADSMGVGLGVQLRITSVDQMLPPSLDSRVTLVSLDYGKTIGPFWRTAAGRRRWWEALRRIRAQAPGVLLRAHNVPVDGALYRRLREAGVDLIGTKDPAGTAAVLRDSSR